MRSGADLSRTGSPASPGAGGVARGVYEQALRTPGAVALVDGDRRLDYTELDATGAAVTGALRRAGVRPGQAVAVALPRSWQLVCAMLGILRLGALVVPLDAQSPPERRRHILMHSASVAVIHDGTAAPEALPDSVQALPVAGLLAAGHREQTASEPPFTGAPVSFLFYTSGTTGRPKGVEVRDAGVLRLARSGYIRQAEGARFACLSNPAFDALSFEVWVPLLTGGCCVILGDAAVQTPHELAAALLRERVDTAFVTTALFNAVVDTAPDCFAGAGQVLVGGEQLNARLIRRWYRHNAASATRLYNVYGPTESTTFALCHPVPRDFDGDRVPIGRALPGTDTLLVVPGTTRTAAPGETAELLLAGEGLAAGYRNLPEETERCFVPLPRHGDGRTTLHYRTGDLVRADADGLVEYLGRADRQVKVRGFRVEPGELERRIVAHPAVRQAYVCTRRDGEDGPNELLAYVVLGGASSGELSFEEFDRHLAAGLPAYMRPHHIHVVAALPRNANGKVDQAALERAGHRPWRSPHGEEPAATAWQREVLGVAAEVLRVPRPRLGDRWIAVGGDSLKALRLRFEVRRRWGCELSQAAVLDGNLAGIAEAIDRARNADDTPYPVPAAPTGARSAPATSEQQRLWLLQQRTPGSRAYNVGQVLRLEGTVDAVALRRSLRRLVERHPALRTAFEAAPEGLRQVVGEPYDPWVDPDDLPCADADAEPWADAEDEDEDQDEDEPWAGLGPDALREGGTDGTDSTDGTNRTNGTDGTDGEDTGGRAFADRLFGRPFDLAEPRMLRASWLPREGGGLLLLHLHHIAVDGWSLNVLLADLSAGYADALRGEDAAGAVDPVPSSGSGAPTPLDYAVWQAEWFSSPAYLAQRAELRAHYAGLDETSEPDDPGEQDRTNRPGGPQAPAGSRRSSRARLLHTSLDAVRRASVDRLCGELGLTRFQLLLGVFASSLYGVTGSTRPRVAGPVANRPVREFETSVGMFANTVLLPLAVAPREELRGQLRRLGTAAREVLDRQDVALADVLADRETGAGGAPPFDFLFVLENTDFGTPALPGCSSRPLWWAPAEAKCPMTLSVVERADGLDCLWEYADDRFEAAEVAAMAGLFGRALDLLADGATATPAELAAPYRRALPEPGRAEPVSLICTTMAEGFARQVARTPDAPALRSGDSSVSRAEGDGVVSYAELDAYAAALAAELRADHPLPEENDRPCHVALFLEPSVEHVVALLALARLNLTIVPLDPSYPPTLLRRILEQVEPLCVLLPPGGDATFDAVDPGGTVRHPVILSTSGGPAEPAACPAHDGARPLYTLFTSGSTGTPKGVRVPDRTLSNLLQWQAESGGLAAPAATQQFSMLSFDVSFQEIFGTLWTGGCLHLVRPGWRQDAPALLDQLESAGVERVFMPYVALQLLAEHAVHLGRYPSRLREVVTAGEQLVCTDAIRRWFAGMPGARLFNHYGPTETHVVSALCLDGDPARWPDRPAIGRPVAGAVLRVVDEAGEPLPPGRTGDLLIGGTMAARCYLGDTALNEARFVELPGLGLFYRSGDRASFDREGLLHYRGRDDDQIKLSGHRLELGEVEAALLRHPEIVQAVVVRDGDELVACVQRHDRTAGRDADRAAGRDAGQDAGQEPVRAPGHVSGSTSAQAPGGTPGQAPGSTPGQPLTARTLTAHLASLLPPHVRVGRFRLLGALPRTPSGKLDRRGVLRAPGEELRPGPEAAAGLADVPANPLSPREARLAEAFEAVTGSAIGPDQTFFDAGASSLGLMRFHLRCTTELGLRFTVADLFEHVTLRALTRFLDGRAATAERDPSRTGVAVTTAADSAASVSAITDVTTEAAPVSAVAADEPIAVIGMAVRLPGAPDLSAFWDMVKAGGSGIEHFDAPDGIVGARSQMDGLLAFDPDHFGISRQEARLMDPQQRHLLMSCADALAHAGIADPSARRVGLIAGAGENTYFQAMLREADPGQLPDGFRLALHHEKDYLATKAAYHLGLTGPAFTAQAACASSLVAVHLAAGLLRQGDADVMLAGGVLVDTELTDGYRYRPQHIFSVDGHCRAFSDDASGTIGASGVGVVVLKPLRLARRDGDTVYAVITGSAINNDGSDKLSYSAPSLSGQREVIRAALRRAGRGGADLGYVEAHGTGTRLGDPVEVGALRQAFDLAESGRCALTSVKSQIGHLGAAAGVVGLVRATLAVHHGLIPPHADFHALSPQIGPDPTPFYIPTEARAWPAGRDRVAAVSSFGIGGTNAHVLLEADERGDTLAPDATEPCLVLSSSSEAGLRRDAARIADYLTARPEAYRQVLRHVQAGRPARRLRIAAVCPDASTAVEWLRRAVPGVGQVPVSVPAPVAVAIAVAGEEESAGESLAAAGRSAEELAEAWRAGRRIDWPAGPAQAPWDFPPPAFELAEYDFTRTTRPARPVDTAGGERPSRLPEADWLHQPHWVRLRRAAPRTASRTSRLLVVLTDRPAPPETVRAFAAVYTRVVRVSPADAFARRGEDVFEVDPSDHISLARLLDALAEAGRDGIDWLHALPLAVEGPVGSDTLAHAHRACLDTPAALVRAVAAAPGAPRVRPWWLSYRARPVDGSVSRPELNLLAGAVEVAPQEGRIDGHWLDLPSADLADWAPRLAALLAGADAEAGPGVRLPRQLALRQGFWWEQITLPVSPAGIAPMALLEGETDENEDGKGGEESVHLILGGTGGLGTALAAWLLERTEGRVLLLARTSRLPAELTPWSDRVELIEADLAATALSAPSAPSAPSALEEILSRIGRRTARLDSVIHAAGVAAGGLLVRRDATAMRQATAAKVQGALLMERLIERYLPEVAVYCSSMSALLGGVGQFDYAAANALLDGFAHHRSGDAETTARITVNWDVWRETGMALRAPLSDARHQAHLSVGLTVDEGKRLFARAVGLRLPQLLVSTTGLDESRVFYAASAPSVPSVPFAAASSTTGPVPAPVRDSDGGEGAREGRGGATDTAAGLLAERLSEWVGVDQLDLDVPLYDLGADSLTMLDLISEVKRHFGVELELSWLSHRVSLNEILTRLDSATPEGTAAGAADEEVALEVWQEGTGREVLCLVHPVGGDIQAYRSLVSALGPRLTVCLIADPALRRPVPPDWTLAERARRYRAALLARFPEAAWRLRLAGWSFGAWVAAEMAAQAEAAGRPVETLHLLDPAPPGAGTLFQEYDETQLEAVFAAELRHSGDESGTSAGDHARAYAERLAHCCRANLRSMAGHRVRRLAVTPSGLWLAERPVAGMPSLGSPDEQRALWRPYLPESTAWHRLDTTHYGIVRPPYVEAVAESIDAGVHEAPEHR
ncbi:amino acid adenylation domain-containing protein [Streptomyces sp. NPDC092295]|uniref:amino acid adenylation domain-containing protein n=1 Tax=Streptomyces sp. NPDC092295 TaxID=3366011 RepID=UPI00382D0167